MIHQIRQDIGVKQLSSEIESTQEQSNLVQIKPELSAKTETHYVQNTVQNKNEYLLKQRDQVFLDFAHMLQEMSEGRKPSVLYIKNFLAQQQTLLQEGLISQEEANAHIEFLRKVLPEFNAELTRAHEKIKVYL